jgi:hypothetical protein
MQKCAAPPLIVTPPLAAGDIVLMPGSAQLHLPPLQAVAENFGWMVRIAHDLCEVAAAQANRKTVALLFCRDTLGQGYSWLETIRLFKRALPEVRLLPCHGFSEPVDWPELCDAGAFHALWLPLKENEVRQSLGFVREAEKRLARSPAGPSEIAASSSSLMAITRWLPPGRSPAGAPDSLTHAGSERRTEPASAAVPSA